MFINLINQYVGSTADTTVRAHFGVSIPVICMLWHCISTVPNVSFLVQPVHLLYALYFMKVYTTCLPAASFWKCDVKTFRVWTWRVIFMLFLSLKTVSKSNYLKQ